MAWADVQAAIDAANAANESRYQAILSGYQGLTSSTAAKNAMLNDYYNQRYHRIMNEQSGIGDSERLALGDQWGSTVGKSQQSMLSRGLGNTTLFNSNRRGIDTAYNRNMIDLNDKLQRQRSDLDIKLSGDILQDSARSIGMEYGIGKDVYDFMERKNEVAPDLSIYAAMARESAANAGGAGSGGFGVAGGLGGGGMSGGGGGGGRRNLAERMAENYGRSYRPLGVGAGADPGLQGYQISAAMNAPGQWVDDGGLTGAVAGFGASPYFQQPQWSGGGLSGAAFGGLGSMYGGGDYGTITGLPKEYQGYSDYGGGGGDWYGGGGGLMEAVTGFAGGGGGGDW